MIIEYTTQLWDSKIRKSDSFPIVSSEYEDFISVVWPTACLKQLYGNSEVGVRVMVRLLIILRAHDVTEKKNFFQQLRKQDTAIVMFILRYF